MHISKNLSLFLLRVTLGFYLFYAGLSHVLDKTFTAAGFLKSATTFPAFYAWFALPANIGWVNILNEWGLLLTGLAIVAGFYIEWTAWAGIALMALYYLPQLQFPYVPSGHAFIVDQHIIYIAALLVLMATRAGKFWGWDSMRE